MRLDSIIFIILTLKLTWELRPNFDTVGTCYRIINSREDHWVVFKLNKYRHAIPPYFMMTVKVIYTDMVNPNKTRNETFVYHLKHFTRECTTSLKVGYGSHIQTEIEFKIYLSFGVQEYFFTEYNFILLDEPFTGVHFVDSHYTFDNLFINFQKYYRDVILIPEAGFNIQELDFQTSAHDDHSCVVIMYKNRKKRGHKYSTSITMEIKAFKDSDTFPGQLLYEFNLTGFRTECTRYYNIEAKNPYLFYPEKWEKFHLQTRIIDVFYGTVEVNLMHVSGQNKKSNFKADFYFTNLNFLPINSRNFSDYSGKLTQKNSYIMFLGSYQIRVYYCIVDGKASQLEEYMIGDNVFEVTLYGFFSYGKNHHLLVAQNLLEHRIQECKNRITDYYEFN
ncbi:hypothetical protein RF11_09048 [Thelohanellus kitauei]|uniref:Uncharacterized protein n=1 Tax=Thelohanellus kitauei TaxID=669202 RepID=A0A0C2JMX3_THEKT|nr:hypothetical protein RF11_09048 [Thelohanellus kitauei]